MTSVLAIDAGQTGIKVRVQTPDQTAERVFPGIHTHRPLFPQLAAAARETTRDLGIDVEVVVAGVSGLREEDTDAAAFLDELGLASVRQAALAHDSVTSYLGALGESQGAVVASGTGVVTLGVGPETVWRVDGWGYVMGDAGSGYWIGREALDAVMRAYDGRGPATSLTDVVRAVWSDLPSAYVSLQASETRVSDVASFARPVAEAAAAGDAVAIGISRRAGDELAQSVAAALRHVGIADADAPVAAIGGAFSSALLSESFVAALAERAPNARVVEPAGVGMDGVLALATLPEGHPLAGVTAHARR